MICARLVFGQMWKNVDVPSLDHLIEKVYEVMEMDILKQRKKEGNLEKTRTYWEPFYNWINYVKKESNI